MMSAIVMNAVGASAAIGSLSFVLVHAYRTLGADERAARPIPAVPQAAPQAPARDRVLAGAGSARS